MGYATERDVWTAENVNCYQREPSIVLLDLVEDNIGPHIGCRHRADRIRSFCQCEHGLVSLGPNSHSNIDAKLQSLGSSQRVVLSAADFDTLALLVDNTPTVVTLAEFFSGVSFSSFSYVPLPWKTSSVSWAVL